MIKALERRLRELAKRNSKFKAVAKSIRHPVVLVLGYLYGSYLTLRYVDYRGRFPALVFQGALIRIGISKGLGSRLEIHSRLIIEPLSFRRTPSSLVLGNDATIVFADDFFIGDDVQIVAYDSAKIYIAGKLAEAASGVSAKSLIHARRSIRIGCDAIIAQDTYLTDSDWHPIEGLPLQQDLIVGNHVWIATGARLLKGCTIGDNSIVACGAVVTGKVFPNNSLIAGVPARVVASNINHWRRNP